MASTLNADSSEQAKTLVTNKLVPQDVGAGQADLDDHKGASEAYFEAIENRRTYYGLSAESPLTPAQLDALVQRALKAIPTSFNMQHLRAAVVTGQWHHKLWNTIWETQKPTLGSNAEQEKQTKTRIDGFLKAHGSVVFFNDRDALKTWSSQMPYLTELFNSWADVSNGMLQHAVWTVLEKEGLGANLQHNVQTSPDIQKAVCKLLDVSEAWESVAVMPFGKPIGPPGNPAHPKDFEPMEKRFKSLHG